MASQERLALQGAIAELERKAQKTRLQAKGAAALLRAGLSAFELMHLDELDLASIEANFSLFLAAMRALREQEGQLSELQEAL